MSTSTPSKNDIMSSPPLKSPSKVSKDKAKTKPKQTKKGSTKKKAAFDPFQGFGNFGAGEMGDLQSLFNMGLSSEGLSATGQAKQPSPAPEKVSPPQKPLSMSERVSSWIGSYEGFVSESFWYTSFLEGLKSLTLFLPGRLSPDGVGAQSVYTLLSLLTHYNDVILGTAQPTSVSSVNISGYSQSAADLLPALSRHINTLLFIISSTECLMETVSIFTFNALNKPAHDKLIQNTPGDYFRRIENRKFTSRQSSFRWKAVLVIELVKFALRMVLLYLNRGKMLTTPPSSNAAIQRLQRLAGNDVRKFRTAVQMIRERKKLRESGQSTESPVEENEIKDSSSGDSIPPALRALQEMYLRHGRGQVPHGSFVHQMESALHPKERLEYVPPISNITSEVLYWIRPSLFVAARVKYGDMSWTPLFISAITDFFAKKLAGPYSSMSPQQKAQWEERTKLYFYYIFRSPLFNNLLMSPLNWLVKRNVPGISFVTTIIREICVIIQQLYFNTAAS